MTDNVSPRIGSDRHGRGYVLVRLLVGAFLWFGTVTKGYQVATEPIADGKWFAIFSCQYEWWLGLLLISGVLARPVRLLALATFLLFSAVSGYQAFQGAESCGCFGTIHVDPRITLTLDLLVVVCLTVTRPAAAGVSYNVATRRSQAAVLLVGALAAALGFWPMWSYESSRLALDGQILGDAREVLIEPTDWLGKACPLFTLSTIDKRLSRGRWVVLLHHSDCPGCHELLSAWPDSVLCYAPGSKTAIVSASNPPLLSPKTQSVVQKSQTIVSRLPDTHTWFIPTPTVLCLVDGLVTKTIVQGEESDGSLAYLPSSAKPATGDSNQVPQDESGPASDAILASGNQHNLEFIEPKSTHRVRFVLDNATEDDWTIRSVRSECNCMKCINAPKTLGAGKSVAITIELKAPEKSQTYSKQVVVFTDSQRAPAIKYRLTARIGLPLRVVPATMNLDRIPESREYEQTIEVVNDGQKPVKVLYTTSTDAACYARVPARPVAGGSRLRLPVVFGRGRGPLGPDWQLSLHTDCKEQRILIVSARRNAQGTTGEQDQ